MKHFIKLIVVSGVVFFASCTKTIVLSDSQGHNRAIKVSGHISSSNIDNTKLLQFKSNKGTHYSVPEGVYSYIIK